MVIKPKKVATKKLGKSKSLFPLLPPLPNPNSKTNKNKPKPNPYNADGRLRKATLDTETLLQDQTGQIDFEGMVRKEYIKLHRQYRLMESTRMEVVIGGTS